MVEVYYVTMMHFILIKSRALSYGLEGMVSSGSKGFRVPVYSSGCRVPRLGEEGFRAQYNGLSQLANIGVSRTRHTIPLYSLLAPIFKFQQNVHPRPSSKL